MEASLSLIDQLRDQRMSPDELLSVCTLLGQHVLRLEENLRIVTSQRDALLNVATHVQTP